MFKHEVDLEELEPMVNKTKEMQKQTEKCNLIKARVFGILVHICGFTPIGLFAWAYHIGDVAAGAWFFLFGGLFLLLSILFTVFAVKFSNFSKEKWWGKLSSFSFGLSLGAILFLIIYGLF